MSLLRLRFEWACGNAHETKTLLLCGCTANWLLQVLDCGLSGFLRGAPIRIPFIASGAGVFRDRG